MLWPEQRCILRSSKPLVRLSQKDFLFPETRTLMAPPEKPICPFPSPVQKGKERFTRQQGSLLVSGTIRLSSSRSQTGINGSTFFNGRRQRTSPDHPMKAAINTLSVSSILFGILGGIIGIAAGLFFGFALGSVLAAALHVPSREGEAAYFTVAIALIVACIVVPVSILATLYWRGVRSIWLFIGLVMVCVSIAAIGASGLGIWYAAQPHVLNLNGPTPLLEFEVKPPVVQSLYALANVESQLDTDRNSIPGYWDTEASENPGVAAGYFQIYYLMQHRLFVLTF